MIPTEPYALAILGALQHKRRGEIYAGTVSQHVIDRRRAANKAARAARRHNRG